MRGSRAPARRTCTRWRRRRRRPPARPRSGETGDPPWVRIASLDGRPLDALIPSATGSFLLLHARTASRGADLGFLAGRGQEESGVVLPAGEGATTPRLAVGVVDRPKGP